MQRQFALERPVQRFPDAARQMNVRGVDADGGGTFLDFHNSMQRVLSFFLALEVARQIEDFVPVCADIAALEQDHPGRIIVAYTQTGLAHLLMRVCGP